MSTATGRTYNAVSGLISGLIALTLALRTPSSFTSFMAILQQVSEVGKVGVGKGGQGAKAKTCQKTEFGHERTFRGLGCRRNLVQMQQDMKDLILQEVDNKDGPQSSPLRPTHLPWPHLLDHRQVILESLEVIDRQPFGSGHPSSIYRDMFLHVMLPPHKATRASRLRVLLTGDLMSERIVWYCPGGAGMQERVAFSWALAEELLPGRFEVFSRTRWLGSMDPLTQAGLLTAHNLLERVVRRWVPQKGQQQHARAAPRRPTTASADRAGAVAFDVAVSSASSDVAIFFGENIRDV